MWSRPLYKRSLFNAAKSLLEIDSTIETWISFGSVWTSLWRLRATDRTYALKQAASLLGIVLYVLFGSALQLTATGVLGAVLRLPQPYLLLNN